MNHFWFILMGGGGTGEPASGGSAVFTIIWFGLIFLIMYLLMIRPQRKKQKELERLVSELKKGDKVLTTSGIFGTIFAIDEERNRVTLKVHKDTELEIVRSAIAARVDK
ncbi:MAG: preprotein translocase subunit YajC [candidate division Zixibacteria bacterium]|nr:preprotein translocase subunit YajC [candidate division Zixibacteria bacterium]